MGFIHPKRILRKLFGKDRVERVSQSISAWRIARKHSSTVRRLRKKVDHSPIRVVFYTNEPQKWSYESLYRAFESNPRFEPLVVVVPRYAVHLGKDRTRMTLEQQYDFYRQRGYRVEYGYKDGRYLEIASFQPDIFFYLQLAEIPGVDDPAIVSKYALTCYCPYAFPLADYRKEYLQQFHRLLFRYYVVHDWTRDRFEGYAKGNSRNCVVVGYPKLDVYFKDPATDADRFWRDPSKVRIIYAPHHSVSDTFKFSTFPSNHGFILDLAKKATGTTWVFKPHPMLRRSMMLAGVMTEKESEEYFREWAGIGRVYDQGDYFDLFKSSDLMITDCGSFLAEYLPSGKPLIRLINDRSCALDRLGSGLSDCFYKVHDNEELKCVFDSLVIDGNDSLAARRNEIAATLVDRSEPAARKIVRDLQSVLDLEDAS